MKNTSENAYIKWCKRLNTHLLGILFATTSGAALNIATGSVSNIYHQLSILAGILATVVAFLLFLWRNKIDEAIDIDQSPRTYNENFLYYCRHQDSAAVKTYFWRLRLFVLSFCAIIIFMYLGAVRAEDDDQKSQREMMAQSLEGIKSQISRQQAIIDKQHATILNLLEKIETHHAKPQSDSKIPPVKRIKRPTKEP